LAAAKRRKPFSSGSLAAHLSSTFFLQQCPPAYIPFVASSPSSLLLPQPPLQLLM